MNKQKLISVIMSVYNEPVDYIRQSIDSILNQTVKNLTLIIIIDDPSNFDAIDYIKRISAKDNRVEYYINDVNRGLVFSLNRALSYVKTKYVARMDADDISLPNRLEEEFNFLKTGKYDLVGCNLNDIDEFGKKASKITVYPESNDKQVKYLKFRNSMAHPSWLGKTEVFKKLNGYRDILSGYSNTGNWVTDFFTTLGKVIATPFLVFVSIIVDIVNSGIWFVHIFRE